MHEILIDITRLLGRSLKGRLPTGVDRVSLAYIRHFAGRARAVVRFGGRTATFPKSASGRLFGELLQPSSSFYLKVPRLIREVLSIRSARNLTGTFLVNTGHSGLEVEDYSMRLRRRGVKPLFMVHDLIPITHPEYCRAGERNRHLVRMTNALLSSGVIANSQATLGELRYFAAKAGLPVPPAVVAPLAPTKLPPPSSRRPMDSPYFVVLGTIEPRKNHWMLLQVWRKMIECHGENAPRLVVIGQRGWECENIMDLLDRCEVLRGFVIELPACSDADLATYLYHARALLFPSFAEGYGLPLTEALSLNVPVIASDLPVFREIAGDIPDYISPLDGMGWMRSIEAFADKNSPVRTAQLDRISEFTSPTWSAHFTAVEDLLGQLSRVH